MKSIIMQATSVTRILHGLKTQTRRLVKVPASGDFYRFDGFAAVFTCGTCVYPRFAPGNVVYLKERWGPADDLFDGVERDPPQCIAYADKTARYCQDSALDRWVAADTRNWGWHHVKWRNAMFMPEWASRAKVRITGVRCERLQAIDEAGARAEGCVRDRYREPGQGVNETGRIVVSAREVFAREWDKINPKAPFASNPLVWVYTFEVHREAT